MGVVFAGYRNRIAGLAAEISPESVSDSQDANWGNCLLPAICVYSKDRAHHGVSSVKADGGAELHLPCCLA